MTGERLSNRSGGRGARLYPITISLSLIVTMGLALPFGPAFAQDFANCFQTNCQNNAQACTAAAYDAQIACQKAARAGCEKVEFSQKFKCLSTALNLCRPAHESAETACVDAVKSCSAACGKPTGKAYWCTGLVNEAQWSGFCADVAGKRVRDQWEACFRQLSPKAPGSTLRTATRFETWVFLDGDGPTPTAN
jgi:hypothetical protein